MPLTTDEKLLALSRETIAVFDKANGGVHPGFRPVHAKGILLTGTFTSSPEAASLTRAPHLHRSSTPVTVRFSDFAGIPTVADNDPQGAGPRGFAVRFHLAPHAHTDLIAHSVDSFPVRTAEGLVEFLNAPRGWIRSLLVVLESFGAAVRGKARLRFTVCGNVRGPTTAAAGGGTSRDRTGGCGRRMRSPSG